MTHIVELVTTTYMRLLEFWREDTTTSQQIKDNITEVIEGTTTTTGLLASRIAYMTAAYDRQDIVMRRMYGEFRGVANPWRVFAKVFKDVPQAKRRMTVKRANLILGGQENLFWLPVQGNSARTRAEASLLALIQWAADAMDIRTIVGAP